MMMLNSIAELRRAKETAEFFDSLLPEEQPARLDELLGRCRFSGANERVPYVCLLDTGINNGHPLIAPALSDLDLHTVEPEWGTDDAEGHGTALAGLALAGNLTEALASDETIEIRHRLESVKLLPTDGGNVGDPRHHGYLTTEAVARPEITDPYRHRVFGMAVTAKDNRDRGRPSAWSAALDRLATDVEGNSLTSRLLVVSAGNIDDPNAWVESPNSNSTDGIHDPAQVLECTNRRRLYQPCPYHRAGCRHLSAHCATRRTEPLQRDFMHLAIALAFETGRVIRRRQCGQRCFRGSLDALFVERVQPHWRT